MTSNHLLQHQRNSAERPEVNADVRRCRTTRTQRPDAMVLEVKGVHYAKCIAYGKAKAANTDIHGKGVDLDVRLAVFSKNYIDVNKLNHVVAFHYSENITFYIEKSQGEGAYVIAELAQITFRQAISDVKLFIDNISSYYTMYTAFQSIQQSMDIDYWKNNHRETLSTPHYMEAIDKTKSNGRLDDKTHQALSYHQ
ncbi:hypothetical protein INT45_011899 [Circinella minor]|uniref:Uncharacterized protein n=1 Tax=Circinella minor TaxID=1195481 RepID=A0A8H7VI82_9FUNG|nr:hypothetical protein INT45_011899 [Circinella minor]